METHDTTLISSTKRMLILFAAIVLLCTGCYLVLTFWSFPNTSTPSPDKTPSRAKPKSPQTSRTNPNPNPETPDIIETPEYPDSTETPEYPDIIEHPDPSPVHITRQRYNDRVHYYTTA
ncbi:hypothetical protein NEDG_00079 [Nematocida displodere]|uniref:Uncharacterized protein n=1 Tax=Nematocida displodere TaxID=1805483 RepID=A0A177EHZ4_9MICR|nr:hypothetical protein NEDG_00079 [Nematocida displodere]